MNLKKIGKALMFPILEFIRFIKRFRDENKYARLWQDDERLRVSVSLYGSLFINTAYAVLQLGLGLYHASFWYYSMAGYYISLAIMRFFWFVIQENISLVRR